MSPRPRHSSTHSSKPSPVRFAFSQQKFPRVPSVPGPSYINLSLALFSNCPWPPGKTSISIKEAAAEHCDLLAHGQSFGLLESAIGGAKYPKQSGPLTSDVRFARLDKARGVIAIGPVLMEYGQYSGGVVPDAVRYGNSIWLFDCATERGPEVLRLSATTGAILQRTSMPDISRPVVGVDDSGFWMGEAGSSFWGSKVKLGVWLAPLDARHGILLRPTDDVIYTMTASGSSMDIVVGPRPVGSLGFLWKFAPLARMIQLDGNGLGVVSFGATAASATAALSAVLGKPTGHPSAGCTSAYAQTAWHDLIVQFVSGRFRGYRYVDAPPYGVAPSPKLLRAVTPKLSTSAGITLGDTSAEAKRVYPSLRQTGSEFWSTPTGIVFAFYQLKAPSSSSEPIYEIKNSVCPGSL